MQVSEFEVEVECRGVERSGREARGCSHSRDGVGERSVSEMTEPRKKE
jgi:hypothetical protein